MSLFQHLTEGRYATSVLLPLQMKLGALSYRGSDFHRIKILTSSIINKIKHQEPPDVED